jgi:hypothetical protein
VIRLRFFASAQGWLTNVRRQLPSPVAMQASASTSEAQRFKIHRTTAATFSGEMPVCQLIIQQPDSP